MGSHGPLQPMVRQQPGVVIDVALRKELFRSSARKSEPLFGKDNGFSLALRVVDEAPKLILCSLHLPCDADEIYR